MRLFVRLATLGLGLLGFASGALSQAALLPPAVLQFADANGAPLAGGSVRFCVPNTGCTTLKTTWKDAGETQVNVNPLLLDAGGRATIYGQGQYEEQVYDLNGNLVFDGLTTATSAGLLQNTAAQTVLGNATNVPGPATAVALQSPLHFVNGNIGYAAPVVADSSNQLVDSTYGYTTRYATGTNPLTYNISAASTLYNGFQFTIVVQVTGLTINLNGGDTFAGGGTGLQLFQNQIITLTTDGGSPGKWFPAISQQSAAPSRYVSEVVEMRAAFCPPGTLDEDGSAVSRTTYAQLFNVLGTSYGPGDGSTTFNLPDSGGQFNRGWRPGQTVDAGRTFGSLQLDALQQHGHGTITYQQSNVSNQSTSGTGGLANNGASTSAPITIPAVSGARVSTETRPTNLATYFCIVTGLQP